MVTSPSIAFRDYRPGDFPTLCEIDRLCFPADIAYTPAEIAFWMRSPKAFAILAEDRAADRVAGFVLARSEGNGRGHIITIEVLPEFRRAGVATALMERAHARLWQLGATYVELVTWVENAPAIAFYEKLGYQIIGRLPRHYPNGMDAWLLAKELSSAPNPGS